MVGTVNASRDDFVRGVDDMIKAEAALPGLARASCSPTRSAASRTTREMLDALTDDQDAIKVYVEVAA